MRASTAIPAKLLVALAVLLALAHAILALTATRGKSMTADEIAYLTAGRVYNAAGDYRLQPENGNLPQRWVALPATLARTPLPAMRGEAWQHADVWRYGYAYFYGENASESDQLLFGGRAMIAIFSAATGLLIFFWSRALFGWRGAFLSLGFFAASPAFLAHGALATSDVMMTFFFLASVGAGWRHLKNPGAAGAALSAVVFGLACVVKTSAVLLVPMGALIAAGWLVAEGSAGRWRALLPRLVRSAVVHAAVAWGIIWLFYGFRFSAFAPSVAEGATFYRGDWDWILTDLGGSGVVLAGLRNWHVLPEAFLYGVAFVLQFAKERAAFLNGDYSTRGWIAFFPYAFLVKTTLPFLLLLLAGFIGGVRSGWQRRTEEWRATVARWEPFFPLLALFVIYWATSLTSHLNIGHRHILPTYPVLFILAGALGSWLDLRRPLAAGFVAVLACWHVGESLKIRPDYLAYFNQLAGGPSDGWRHLADSSLDWGQDLPGLQTWLKQNVRDEPVFLAYFGAGEPDHYLIRARRLPFINGFKRPPTWSKLEPGVYCVGATMLDHVYSGIRGPWTPELEKEYQQLRTLEPAFEAYFHDPQQRATMDREASPEKWERAYERHDLLRFARLCHYLRARQPDAEIGYSILIYRLTAPELAAATTGTYAEWRAAIQRAGGNPDQ